MNACYFVSKNHKHFQSARTHCKSMKADLTIIQSKVEYEVITTLIEYTSEHDLHWVGAFRGLNSSTFNWVNGSTVDSTIPNSWYPGFPAASDGDCVAFKVKNTLTNGLENEDCLKNNKYICAIYNYAVLPTENTKSCPVSSYSASSTVADLYSPAYPSNYPNESDCPYVITAPVGKKIVLTIKQFNTESCCDILNIHDGSDSNAVKIASLRGAIASGTQFFSTSNSLYLRFTSDENVNDKGFDIQYVTA
uniref:CUB domain-containing protein n=1 Tax=Rhabditophanes sp. KR3021 TaxID=114890 RepID=A0AC35UCX5_9BILA